jgi:hypothetical protein
VLRLGERLVLTARLARAVTAGAVVLAVAACSSGQSCEGLASLTEQRDAAREDWAALTAEDRAGGPAPTADVDAAHDRMHAAETEHESLRAACEERV